MELKSLAYLAFAALIIIIYFAVSKVKNAQKYTLLIANLFFILVASGIKSFLIILLLTEFSFVMGQKIEKSVQAGDKDKAKKLMWFNVVVSVGMLCYFKFLRDTFEIIVSAAASHGLTIGSLLSPIGVSYFTLTMVAYALDILHKKHPAEKSFIDYLVFITYFPSIIEGPINLYKKVAPQFKEVHTFEEKRVIMGLQRSLWGYIKKVVIADRIGIIVTGILQDDTSAGFVIFWAMILYSFQIYADFSGGIDVIMGISEILDIKLSENFRSPLISKSVTEYWQRWHMSLGEFMEKYIYYPIVLNRSVMKFSKKIPNKYMQRVFSATLASIIVFVIVGIWHGTGWNYVAYGCYQAFFVSTAVLLGPWYKKAIQALHIPADSITLSLFRIFRTFVLLTLGRYFIRAKNLTQAIGLFGKTFLGFHVSDVHILFDNAMFKYGLDEKNVYLMYLCLVLMIIVDVVHEHKIQIRETLLKQDIVFRYIVYILAVFFIVVFGIYGPEFSASSFIYAGF